MSSSLIVLVSNVDQLFGDADLSHAVSRVRDDGEGAVGQSLVQLPGAGGRTHNIITALNNVHWNARQLGRIFEDEALLQKYPIDKVMAFNPSKSRSEVLN